MKLQASLVLQTSIAFAGLSEALRIPLIHKKAPVARDESPIKTGYVAFGDSYAAGIGTGNTDTGGCRRGQFSSPKQLAGLADGEIDFQNLPCSGAVVGEILGGGGKSQIDDWQNPDRADIATFSVGGNDIGFYNILTSCVLRVGQAFAGDCDHYINEGYDLIEGRLKSDILTALDQIMKKSGRDDLKIFVTGYPTFFNEETDYCDCKFKRVQHATPSLGSDITADTTFYQWEPGHHDIHHGGDWAYLTKQRRTDLNKLVQSLNRMLRSAADDVKKLRIVGPEVTFIDPNDAYNGHRFCEPGAEEPDSNRDDTWLFLSAWPDNSLPGQQSKLLSILQDTAERSEPQNGTFPDDETCKTSWDWSDQMLCELKLSGHVTEGDNGVSILDEEIRVDEIGWFIPTRSAKTFHPRSLGQKAYVDLIRDSW